MTLAETPLVTFAIPTFNCESILSECLKLIRSQDYPQEKIEIIISDGFSTDGTRDVAGQFDARVIDNPDISHPMGRPLAFEAAQGDLICCLDSDNLLVEPNWLSKMVAPFEDVEIVASEPLYYRARTHDNWLTRYVAVLGADDPVIIDIGNYDRFCGLTGRWTDIPVSEKDCGDYLRVHFPDPEYIPTLGANGTIFRRDVLLSTRYRPFHHVDASYQIIQNGNNVWAKVRCGIVHRHGDTLLKFIQKKRRRVERRMNTGIEIGYSYPVPKKRVVWSAIKSLLVFPIVIEACIGAFRRPDYVWIFHPIVKFAVTVVYTFAVLRGRRSRDTKYEQV